MVGFSEHTAIDQVFQPRPERRLRGGMHDQGDRRGREVALRRGRHASR